MGTSIGHGEFCSGGLRNPRRPQGGKLELELAATATTTATLGRAARANGAPRHALPWPPLFAACCCSLSRCSLPSRRDGRFRNNAMHLSGGRARRTTSYAGREAGRRAGGAGERHSPPPERALVLAIIYGTRALLMLWWLTAVCHAQTRAAETHNINSRPCRVAASPLSKAFCRRTTPRSAWARYVCAQTIRGG